jgi:TRAP transporter TAXI family solute receptor
MKRPPCLHGSGKTALRPETFFSRLALCGDTGCVLRQGLSLLCAVLIALLAGQSARAAADTDQSQANAWLGLIAGAAAGSETAYASDMASLVPQGGSFRIRPVLGDAGAGNLAALLNDPQVDIAFVGTDALAKEKGLADKLELVARLSPQEVHVLARADLGAVSDLAGKPVNFGPAGSASAITGAKIFKALGLDVQALDLDAAAAIERLKRGEIAAVVVVGGKPLPLVSAIPANAGIRLLPIPFGAPLEASYLPTEIEPDAYPNLIQSRAGVTTVATGMALVAAKLKNDPGVQERVTRFISTIFPRFAKLQVDSRHPKWREVNLAASLPGYTRSRAAETWLSGRSEAEARPVASASAAPAPSLGEGLMSNEQKEALFKRFIQWQRGKER